MDDNKLYFAIAILVIALIFAFTYYKHTTYKSSDNNNMLEIKSTTFDKYVKNRKQNIMVEYYAPWCKFCKELVPTYEKLHNKYKQNKSVRIAKLDATKHKVPEQINSYPTIIFYPKHGQSHKYEGVRNVETMAKFIEEHKN